MGVASSPERERIVIDTRAQTDLVSTRSLLVSALLVSLGAAVGQGFARFGYALLLTPMQRTLSWSYAQAGLVNSANALGYLAGSLAVGRLMARWGAVRVVRISLLAVSCSLVTTGLFDGASLLVLSRIVAGIGTGLLFVAGVAVVLALDSSPRSDFAVGVYYAGPGIGIVLSGILVPVMLGPLGWDWHTAWIALGVLGFLTMAAVEIPLRATQRVLPVRPAAITERLFVPRDYLTLWPAMVAYTLFGLGYIGYMTFAVAYLRSIDVAPALVQGFWIVLGIFAASSGFTWRPLIRRLQPHHMLSLVLATLATGALLPVLVAQTWSFVLSAVLFGGTFTAVANVVTLQVRAQLPPARWTMVMGNAVALFAVGQLIGPTLTGLVSDMRGGLALGLLGSALILALGAIVALRVSRPNDRAPVLVKIDRAEAVQ